MMPQGNYSSEKVDFIRVEGNIFIHKQVEMRDGRVYMRMKRRLLPIEI